MPGPYYCGNPPPIVDTCTSLSSLSCVYMFQEPNGHIYAIQNYLRLKLINNNPDNLEIEKLDKPFYVFRSQKSNTSTSINYSGKIPILSYDKDTLTYALSYNANDRKLFPAIANLKDVIISKNNTNKIKGSQQKTVFNLTTNYQNIPIHSFNKNLSTLNFYPAGSALMNCLLSGNFLTSNRKVTLSGVLYDKLSYLPNIASFSFLIDVSSRNSETGEIEFIPLNNNLNNALLKPLLSAQDENTYPYDVGYILLNSITVSQDVWGDSYYTLASATYSNFTTTNLISTNKTGLKAPVQFPFIVSSYAVNPYGSFPPPLTGVPIDWDMADGANNLKVLAKRHKIYITSYDCNTRTYTVSGGFPWIPSWGYDSIYFYPNLFTKVYKNNQVKDVQIQSVNYQQQTFKTFEEVWYRSYTVPASAQARNYILDKQIEYPDSAAGSYKIFKKDASNSNESLISSFDVIYPNLSSLSKTQDLSARLLTYPFHNGKIIRDKGILSGYSIPYALYFKKQDFRYRYYACVPVGRVPPGEPQPVNCRWLYSNKTAFTEYNFKTIPFEILPIALYTQSVFDSSFIPVFGYYAEYPSANIDIYTYSYQSPITTDIPYRVEAKAFSKTPPYSEIASTVYYPLSVSCEDFSGLPPGCITITNYESLCAATSGNSTFGKYVTVAGNEFNFGHTAIVDDYTKNIHLYIKDSFASLGPYGVIPPLTSWSNGPINIIEIGKNITSKLHDEGSFIAVDYKYEYISAPGVYHYLFKVYRLKHGAVPPGGYVAWTGYPTIYSYSSESDITLNSPFNNSEITGMKFISTENKTKKKGVRKFIAVSRAFNSYYAPFSGTVEFHSYDSDKIKDFVIQNTNNETLLGVKIDAGFNTFIATLSHPTQVNSNIVNVYSLSSYLKQMPIPSQTPTLTPTPWETPDPTPTPTETPPP